MCTGRYGFIVEHVESIAREMLFPLATVLYYTITMVMQYDGIGQTSAIGLFGPKE